jgi:hypothetical protein
MKIRPVGAELFHTDGQTDVTKLVVAFRNFANALKNTPVTSCKFKRVQKLCHEAVRFYKEESAIMTIMMRL